MPSSQACSTQPRCILKAILLGTRWRFPEGNEVTVDAGWGTDTWGGMACVSHLLLSVDLKVAVAARVCLLHLVIAEPERVKMC